MEFLSDRTVLKLPTAAQIYLKGEFKLITPAVEGQTVVAAKFKGVELPCLVDAGSQLFAVVWVQSEESWRLSSLVEVHTTGRWSKLQPPSYLGGLRQTGGLANGNHDVEVAATEICRTFKDVWQKILTKRSDGVKTVVFFSERLQFILLSNSIVESCYNYSARMLRALYTGRLWCVRMFVGTLIPDNCSFLKALWSAKEWANPRSVVDHIF